MKKCHLLQHCVFNKEMLNVVAVGKVNTSSNDVQQGLLKCLNCTVEKEKYSTLYRKSKCVVIIIIMNKVTFPHCAYLYTVND